MCSECINISVLQINTKVLREPTRSEVNSLKEAYESAVCEKQKNVLQSGVDQPSPPIEEPNFLRSRMMFQDKSIIKNPWLDLYNPLQLPNVDQSTLNLAERTKRFGFVVADTTDLPPRIIVERIKDGWKIMDENEKVLRPNIGDAAFSMLACTQKVFKFPTEKDINDGLASIWATREDEMNKRDKDLNVSPG